MLRRRFSQTVLLSGMIFLVSAKGSTAAPADGHILIRFKEGRGPGLNFDAAKSGFPEGVRLERSGFGEWKKNRGRSPDAESRGGKEHFVLRLPPGLKPKDCLEQLRNHANLEYAELDYVATAAGGAPNDPDFGLQWHHNNPGGAVPADIQSLAAWELTRGSSNIVVAVLDTGINAGLEEFSGRLAPGYDFVNRDANPNDDNGHGTEVAGVLGANGNNGQLIAGVDWNCRIMPVKVLASDRSGLFSTLADGIYWAVDHGARVITLSAGGLDNNLTLSNAVNYALESGVTFVAAAHNDGGAIRFPARMDGVIAVGATTQTDRRASFSNFGPELSLVAPGTNIYTFGRSGVRVRDWGTSLAVPQVAAAVSLLLSVRPDLKPEQIGELLCAGADDQVGVAWEDLPGFDPHHGYGRLNLRAALELARTTLTVSATGGEVVVRWGSPANAVQKRSYALEGAEKPDGPWTFLAGGEAIRSAGAFSEWSMEILEEGGPKFFRVSVSR